MAAHVSECQALQTPQQFKLYSQHPTGHVSQLGAPDVVGMQEPVVQELISAAKVLR